MSRRCAPEGDWSAPHESLVPSGHFIRRSEVGCPGGIGLAFGVPGSKLSGVVSWGDWRVDFIGGGVNCCTFSEHSGFALVVFCAWLAQQGAREFHNINGCEMSLFLS